jgi:hypothetical protein
MNNLTSISINNIWLIYIYWYILWINQDHSLYIDLNIWGATHFRTDRNDVQQCWMEMVIGKGKDILILRSYSMPPIWLGFVWVLAGSQWWEMGGLWFQTLKPREITRFHNDQGKSSRNGWISQSPVLPIGSMCVAWSTTISVRWLALGESGNHRSNATLVRGLQNLQDISRLHAWNCDHAVHDIESGLVTNVHEFWLFHFGLMTPAL